ncbi:Bug family tripartite tricarboxylate transporter substrate binding protein [Celerinatantimonas sp. MCCC 1A17872]|uniref:Bug family tripartite tricarboxylate transporter substrate binding protein n=1 Tax=Celerinatantimonas sp. MCCC 1A17872 TaxID=3177514 RepID=UPI0038C6BAEA
MALTRREFNIASLILGSNLLLPRHVSAAENGHILTGYKNLDKSPIEQVVNKSIELVGQSYTKYQYKFEEELGNNSINAVVKVKDGPTDGSCILFTASPQMSIFPELYRQLPYNPLNDFKPLVLLAGYSFLFTVGPTVDKSVKTLDDYIKWVENTPEYRNVGFTQYGSSGHMAMQILARAKNVAIRPQAYSDINQVAVDLKDGNLAAAIILTGFSMPEFKDGTFRALAATSQFRHPGFHDVPTCRELGIKDMDISGWFGLFVPKTTPDNVYLPLMYGFQNTIIRGEFINTLQKNYFKPMFDSPEQITIRLKQHQAYYRNLIEQYKMTRL